MKTRHLQAVALAGNVSPKKNNVMTKVEDLEQQANDKHEVEVKGSKWMRIKRAGHTAGLSSTLHGFSNILRSDWLVIQIMWSFFIIMSTTGVVYFVAQSIIDFGQFDVITETQIVREREVNFPAVTICNRQSASYSLKDLIYKCEFEGNQVCSSADWEPFSIFDTQGRVKTCYRFNTLSNHTTHIRKTTKFGYTNGLHIYIYMPNNDFINYYISEYHVEPVNSEIYRFLDGGLTSNLVLSKFVEGKQGEPFNECQTQISQLNDHESPLFKQIVANNVTYRQTNCYDLCYFNKISDICDCSFDNIHEVPGRVSCQDSAKQICIHDEYDKFDYYQACKSLCPLECNTTTYGITAQSIKYVTTASKLAFARSVIPLAEIAGLSDTALASRILSLYVFYEDLKFTEITQIAKTTPTDLVSKIGGTLGFFLGLSLLSFIEILELFLEICFISICS